MDGAIQLGKMREWSDQVIFLRKVIPGGADKSYGIHVARLAGLPKSVLTRAKEVLHNLEESELTPEGQPTIAKSKRRKAKPAKGKAGKVREAAEPDLFTGK